MDLSTMNAETLRKYQQADLMRWLSAKALARRDGISPRDYFERAWPRSISKDLALKSLEPGWLETKAATTPGMTTVPAWGGVLVGGAPDALVGAFVPLLQSQSAVLSLPLRRVPFSSTAAAVTSGAVFGWVAEGGLKGLTKFAFASTSVPPTKIAGTIALSEELVRLAVAGSVDAMQTEMVNGATAFIDAQFLDPALAAVAGKNPASLVNGLTPVATGATVAATISALVKAFWTALPNASPQSTLIMSPATASALADGLQAQGTTPTVTIAGGTVSGMRVLTTPGAGNRAIALDPTRVLIAREDRPVLDTSDQASYELVDAPTDPPTAASVPVSAWQTNTILILCEWAIGWVRLANAAQYAVMP